MVTAAIVMSAGREQANHLPVSPERTPVEGVSFAKSFDEGVASAADVPTKRGSDEGAAELRDFRWGVPLKIADELVVAPVAVKAGSVAVPLETAGGAGKVFAAKIVSMAAGAEAAPAGLMPGKKLEEPQQIASGLTGISAGSADGVESVATGVVKNVGGGDDAVNGFGTVATVPDVKAEGSAEAPQVQQNTLVADAADGAAAQGKVVQTRDVVSGDAEGPAGKIKTVGLEETGPGALTNKISKSEKHKGTHAKSMEDAGAVVNVTVMVANPTLLLEGGAAAGVSVPVATTVPVGMQSNETAKGQKSGSGKTISTVRSSEGVAATAVAGKSGNDVTDAGKNLSVSGTAAPLADGTGPAKTGSEFAKSVALAIGADGDKKAQRGDAVAGVSHGAAGEGSALAGLISGVAPSHLTGGGANTKVPVQDGQAAAALHAGHGELDGNGAAMDGGHRTLMASPTTLEVGIANGTHGWLKIRADMATGGVVNASLSAASPAGQEMLHRELPSLTAYLQQEQVAVNTVVVHPAIAGNTSHGVAGGMAGDMSGQAQQRSSQGGEGQQGLAGTISSYMDEAGYENANRASADELSPAMYVGGGSWLNVRV